MTVAPVILADRPADAVNPMGTDGFEFVEFTAPDPGPLESLFHQLGFEATAHHRSKRVTLYAQGDINFIVNAETAGDAAAFARVHGASANAMAFRVKDSARAYARALSLGATPVEPRIGAMELNIPAIQGIGGSALYLVDRYGAEGSIYDIDFRPLPGAPERVRGVGLTVIDHLTHNVGRGRMDYWAAYYERLFNFREIRYFDIEGRLTGLRSRAMTSPDGKIRIPINESADDKSQIEEFLRAYRGEGIQHVALHTDDIYATVEGLKHNGVGFLEPPPATYYEMLAKRLPNHGEDLARMRANGILLDGAPGGGLLLQIFTKTVIGPIFFEIIQRKGDEGFGEGNFRALFESIEQDQVRRGVLKDEGDNPMKRWISFPRVEGQASRQAHADLPADSFERELGKEGFFGPATHMVHRHPPTGWVDWDGPLRPRAFDLTRLEQVGASPFDAPVVLHNAHLAMRFWRAPKAMDHLARNADGDELLFVHDGAAELYCDYGHLSVAAGDYVVLPRSTMWRLECSAPVTALLVEATNGSYRLPDRGLLGAHAQFDPAMLDVPALDDAFRAQQGETETRVRIKRRGAISTVTYPFNPLDAIGWHGDLAPARLNLKDIRPVMSHRYHLPPSAHTTFVADRFVVCSFVPRPFETDPAALKVPFFHNNDDFDEVIFYHAGSFFSRDNIGPGSLTFHPCGFTHGPHPKALKAMYQPAKPATDEYAVMIDSRDALDVGALPEAVENLAYVKSWQSPAK